MRRTLITILAGAMALTAAPVLAQDAEENPESAETQRAESALYGLGVEVPADWSVSYPEGERVSAITNAEGDEVMEATVLYANGGGGTWCDVDAYLRLGEDAPLEGHAFAFVSYLQQNESSEAQMVVVETEVPAGPAYRIEIFEPNNGRLRSMYLFDGPAGADGLYNRYPFSCAPRDAPPPPSQANADTLAAIQPGAEPMAAELADDEMAEDAEEAAAED